jgi:glycosyltransferase involved in cell wall biosynthesis
MLQPVAHDVDNSVEFFEPILHDLDTPLVSVLVYNYNYGKYLEDCLESIIAQTYSNIEILFSDNASTDNSWDVALAFAKKYPGRMTVTRNSRNVGPTANLHNCMVNAKGTYFVTLGSDDVMMPNYIEKCLDAFSVEHRLGYVMVHCAIIDSNGKRRDEPSFYDQSCIIRGKDQAAVYMMAAVNPSVSQIMYHRQRYHEAVTGGGTIASRWYGARINDFNLCTQHPMAYIKEPLLLFRVHGQNESTSVGDDLLEVMAPYFLAIQFAEKASLFNMPKVSERLPQAIEKLSLLALRYCVRYLNIHDEITAKRYFHLSASLDIKVEQSELFEKLQQFWESNDENKKTILDSLTEVTNLVSRQKSYAPPKKSKCLEI